jgi:hypothetical protein
MDAWEQLPSTLNKEEEREHIKTKLATSSTKSMVIQNVGGDKHTASVDTLTCEKATLFTAFFSKQWELE